LIPELNITEVQTSMPLFFFRDIPIFHAQSEEASNVFRGPRQHMFRNTLVLRKKTGYFVLAQSWLEEGQNRLRDDQLLILVRSGRQICPQEPKFAIFPNCAFLIALRWFSEFAPESRNSDGQPLWKNYGLLGAK
jgi:hypothetical protein